MFVWLLGRPDPDYWPYRPADLETLPGAETPTPGTDKKEERHRTGHYYGGLQAIQANRPGYPPRGRDTHTGDRQERGETSYRALLHGRTFHVRDGPLETSIAIIRKMWFVHILRKNLQCEYKCIIWQPMIERLKCHGIIPLSGLFQTCDNFYP